MPVVPVILDLFADLFRMEKKRRLQNLRIRMLGYRDESTEALYRNIRNLERRLELERRRVKVLQNEIERLRKDRRNQEILINMLRKDGCENM